MECDSLSIPAVKTLADFSCTKAAELGNTLKPGVQTNRLLFQELNEIKSLELT